MRRGELQLALCLRGVRDRKTQKGNVLQGIEKGSGEAVAPVAAGCYAVLDAVLLASPRLPAPSRKNLQVQT